MTQASTPTTVPTEMPQPTPTLVNAIGAAQATVLPTTTPTRSAAAGGELPKSGIGEDLMLLAGGLD